MTVRRRFARTRLVGEALGASSQGHRDKHSCYEEIRVVMGEHTDADILDFSVD